MGRFSVGQAVRRSEDPRLLTGRGTYTADLNRPNQARALVLRSPYAHADIGAIDTAPALAVPGVLAVYTGADWAADGLGDIPCRIPVKDRHGNKLPQPGRPVLAQGRVRFVGEPVAFIIAEDLNAARDAADALLIDYRSRPSVADTLRAAEAGAPAVWDFAPDNRAFYWQGGDAAATDAAFAAAAKTFELALRNNRLIPNPMEPRACLGEYDQASGRYTLHTPTQGAHLIKDLLATATLKVDPALIRVVVPDVGGAFGTKIFHYPEEALVLWAAKKLGRPIKWVGERSDSFSGDTHGRDTASRATAAFDAEGVMCGLRIHTLSNMGAYLDLFGPGIQTFIGSPMAPGAYRVPAVHVTVEGVYSNTTPVDAYRGAGRPESAYLVERLMDEAARHFGLDPVTIRRRNLVPPEAIPFRNAMGHTFDSGDFPKRLEQALTLADWDGFAARRQASEAAGKLRGIGLSTYIESCGTAGDEEASAHLLADGRIEVRIGTQTAGQGHETAYAQFASDTLGIDFAAIRVRQGDTDLIPYGNGTGGSRSLPMGSRVVDGACRALIEAATAVAARLWQAGEDEVGYGDGRFHRTATGQTLDWQALAADGAPLEGRSRQAPTGMTYPNGCHVCEVEVDPQTGRVQLLRYCGVDDYGTIVNPLLALGQAHGGIAQGIGQALLERTLYSDEEAQLLSGSFMDYAMPRADDLCDFDIQFDGTPCANQPFGIKGAGEAGTIGATPAVMNALNDALASRGKGPLDMPATPEAVWRALQ